MKRIFNTILTIALVAMTTHTFDTHAVSQAQRNQQRQDLIRKRLVRQKGTPTGRRGTTARTRRALARGRRTPAIQKKSPEIRKQNAQMEQKIEQNTKVLEQAAAQKEKATTPAQKAVATKKVHEATQDLLNSISQKRTWEGDIYNGYEKKEIDEAKLLIEKLTKAKKTIEEKVKKKKEQLAKVTSKGWIFNTPLWNVPVEGKETEYNKLTEEIYKLNNTLDRIDAALADQAVITGTSWSNAYKALLGAGALATAATAANVTLYGSAGIVGKTAIGAKSAIGTGAGWVKDKALGVWNALPGGSTPTIPKIEIDNEKAQVDGTSISKATITSQFGDVLATSTWAALGMAKNMAIQMAVSTAFSLAVKKLMTLLKDPSTTPAQLEAQNKEVQKLAASSASTKR